MMIARIVPPRFSPSPTPARYMRADGTVYAGEWWVSDKGERVGRGRITYNDGSSYNGQWRDDKDGHPEHLPATVAQRGGKRGRAAAGGEGSAGGQKPRRQTSSSRSRATSAAA